MDWKDWRCGGLHWMEVMTMKVIDQLGGVAKVSGGYVLH